MFWTPWSSHGVDRGIQGIFFFIVCLSGCAMFSNPYESVSPEARTIFKKIIVPLPTGTSFKLLQGAFGLPSHQRSGDEYSWDLGVPLGTPVTAAEAGQVIGIWEPNQGGGCHEQYFHLGHYIRIQHLDGTVAQYVHIKSKVNVGDHIEKGQEIAETAQNGWLCKPHLHFGVYRSAQHINAPDNQTLPLYFENIEGGLLKTEGKIYEKQ